MGSEKKVRVAKGSAKVKHIGRTKARVDRRVTKYFTQTMPRRKILHLLKNNSIAEAQSWADKHMGGNAIFLELLPRFKKEAQNENKSAD